MTTKKNLQIFEKILNIGLKIKRELRASRNELRAERREERAEMNHTRKYFGRDIPVIKNDEKSS